MIINQLKLLAGGEAGDGVFAVSDMLALMFARAGLEILRRKHIRPAFGVGILTPQYVSLSGSSSHRG